MRINRRQLRRLIESVINEEMKGEFMSKDDSLDLYGKHLAAKREYEANPPSFSSSELPPVYLDKMSGFVFIDDRKGELDSLPKFGGAFLDEVTEPGMSGYVVIPSLTGYGEHDPKKESMEEHSAGKKLWDNCLWEGEMETVTMPIEAWFEESYHDEVLELIEDIKRTDGPYKGKL